MFEKQWNAYLKQTILAKETTCKSRRLIHMVDEGDILPNGPITK